MSYQSWHYYGYGICVDDIDTNVDRVFSLVHLAPNFEKEFYKWVESFRQDGDPESVAELITMDDIYEYEDNYCNCGIGLIMKAVIQECEDVELLACDDYNCCHYLIFSVGYPWNMSEKEKNITEKDLRCMFAKYVNVLMDEPITVNYQSVENGG
jgi:hypothetical protein